MKLTYLAASESSQALLTSSLRGLGLRAMRAVDTWDDLIRSLVTDRPALVVIEYGAIATEGQQTLASADWALRAMKIPAVIAIPAGSEGARTELELATEFEHFIEAPYDQDLMAAVISDAVGGDSWRAATREVPVVDLGLFEAMQTEPLPAIDPVALRAAAEPSVHASPTRPTPAIPDRPETRTVAAGVVAEAWDPDMGLDIEDDAGAGVELDDTFFSAWDEPVEEAYDPNDETDAFGLDDAPIPDPGPADERAAWGDDGTSPRATGAPVAVGTTGDDGPGPDDDGNANAAEAGFEEPALTEPRRWVLELPSVEAGEFGSARLADVLHALFVVGATGRLRLTQDTLKREVTVSAGVPGREDANTTGGGMQRLLAAFGWTQGQYVFVPERVAPVTFIPFCAALEFIFRGIEGQLSINDLARSLGGEFKRYPVYTDKLDRLEGIRALDGVRSMLLRFDGSAPFE